MALPSSSSIPQPFSFSPSQYWDGNDGKWSTFHIRVGTPGQDFRVLPSSATGEIYIPHPQGCQDEEPAKCGALRGVLNLVDGETTNGFMANRSKTWHEIGIYDTMLRPDLNFSGNGLYGQDTVGLMAPNSGGPVLEKTVVAAVANKNIFVGVFGLSPKPANFSDLNNPTPVFIKELRNQNKIPSLSYGYTAGASYKTPQVFGSLTLGGYDASRFEPHNVTYPMDPDDERPLSVSVQSIAATNSSDALVSLLDDPFYTEIDFTVPHLWLPRVTCDNFANAFGLIYDNTTDLYLVNNTIHSDLLERNPTVTIGLGNTPDPKERVNVVLPYRAFDLQASKPMYENGTNYFPIRRAPENATKYTLGRAFMQEAYVVVDYERGNFSVHQALFPASTEKQSIVTIRSPSDNTTAVESGTSGNRLNGGAIAGIVVGVVAFAALCIGLLAFLIHRRKKARQLPKGGTELQATDSGSTKKGTASDEVYEMKAAPRPELDGHERTELDGYTPQELAAENPRFELESPKEKI